MGELNIEQQPLNDESKNSPEIFNNVKKIRSGDGTFNIANGRIELRDASGNIVVLLDANG
jgi:hypothetical protein